MQVNLAQNLFVVLRAGSFHSSNAPIIESVAYCYIKGFRCRWPSVAFMGVVKVATEKLPYIYTMKSRISVDKRKRKFNRFYNIMEVLVAVYRKRKCNFPTFVKCSALFEVVFSYWKLSVFYVINTKSGKWLRNCTCIDTYFTVLKSHRPHWI